jgi:hypothetical protein
METPKWSLSMIARLPLLASKIHLQGVTELNPLQQYQLKRAKFNPNLCGCIVCYVGRSCQLQRLQKDTFLFSHRPCIVIRNPKSSFETWRNWFLSLMKSSLGSMLPLDQLQAYFTSDRRHQHDDSGIAFQVAVRLGRRVSQVSSRKWWRQSQFLRKRYQTCQEPISSISYSK